jgi:hypothetical protein
VINAGSPQNFSDVNRIVWRVSLDVSMGRKYHILSF